MRAELPVGIPEVYLRQHATCVGLSLEYSYSGVLGANNAQLLINDVFYLDARTHGSGDGGSLYIARF